MIMALNPQQFILTPDAKKQAHYSDPYGSQNADYRACQQSCSNLGLKYL